MESDLPEGWKSVLTLFLLMTPIIGAAQQQCVTGVRVEGVVTDTTGAAIPGAHVEASPTITATTDATGSFALPCVPPSLSTIKALANGFTTRTAVATDGQLVDVLPLLRRDG